MSQLGGTEPRFDRMEPREGATPSTCSGCGRSIPDTYFEAAGKIFCEPCRDAALASMQGGSGFARLLKALVLGSVAAAVSAVIWYGIVALTGYELGIIAIAVGLAVGGAVRFGSEQRGGWLYQMLAIGLTYLAIAASYVPLVFEELDSGAAAEAAAAMATEVDAEAGATPAEAPPIPDELKLVSAIILSLMLPVLQVMEGTGFIGLLIVCFALYEAWKINKRQTLAFSGPFRLQRPAAGTSA